MKRNRYWVVRIWGEKKIESAIATWGQGAFKYKESLFGRRTGDIESG